MRSETLAIAATVLLVAACHTDPKHPRGAAAVPQLDGPVVATVGGRAITVAEATEFAATRDNPTAEALVIREQRVRQALQWDLDVSLERKRAMVRALLADEVEAKVGIDAVEPDALTNELAIVRAELTGVSGFAVTSVRVGSLDLIQRAAELSPERVAELNRLVVDVAEKVYAAVPEDNAIDAVDGLSLDWGEPDVLVEISRDLRVVDADDVREPPAGWVRSATLAGQLADREDGQKTALMEQSGVQMFAVRKQRVEPPPVDDALVRELAEARVLRVKRKERVDELLSGLRDRTSIVMHPQLLEEGR